MSPAKPTPERPRWKRSGLGRRILDQAPNVITLILQPELLEEFPDAVAVTKALETIHGQRKRDRAKKAGAKAKRRGRGGT